MSKKNENFYGGAFDFNRDGETSFLEEMIAYDLMEQEDREREKREETDEDDFDEDGFDDENSDEDGYAEAGYSFSYKSAGWDDGKKGIEKTEKPEKSESAPAMTYEEYKLKRRTFLNDIFGSSALCLIPLVLIGVVFYAAIKVTADSDSGIGGAIFPLLVIGVGFFILAKVFKYYRKVTSESMREITTLDNEYRQSASEEEIKKLGGKKRLKKGIILSVILIFAAVMIAIPCVGHFENKKIYDAAVELTFSGEYDKAIEKFKTIDKDEFYDKSSLIEYCYRKISYENGSNKVYLYEEMKDVKFNYITAEQRVVINRFVGMLKEAYDDYMQSRSEALGKKKQTAAESKETKKSTQTRS